MKLVLYVTVTFRRYTQYNVDFSLDDYVLPGRINTHTAKLQL